MLRKYIFEPNRFPLDGFRFPIPFLWPLRFTPELLGVHASSALVWLIMEVLAVLLSLYLVTVSTDLTTIDLLAFAGYKYVGYVHIRVLFCFFFVTVVSRPLVLRFKYDTKET